MPPKAVAILAAAFLFVDFYLVTNISPSLDFTGSLPRKNGGFARF